MTKYIKKTRPELENKKAGITKNPRMLEFAQMLICSIDL